MLARATGFVFRQQTALRNVRSLSSYPELYLFPRESEGNNYDVNYSLVEDGVTSVGNAYRNARLPLLTKPLGKVNNGVIERASPLYFGSYDVTEAGDTISHDDFASLFGVASDSLSNGQDLFVEDGGLGAYSKIRLGTRVTTDIPAVALIMRKLLISTPYREVNHRSRFKGWNLDPRWSGMQSEWKGDHYVLTETQTVAAPAQRSILTFITDKIDKVSVQFVEKDKEIVGANVIAGASVPVRGLIDAMGHAATVLVNEANENSIALPSLAMTKDDTTIVVVGADDTLLAAVASSKNGTAYSLFGAYHNVISPDGVSALWNGYIGEFSKNAGEDDVPAVKVDGNAAHAVVPNNLAFPASRLIFFDKSAKRGKVSVDDAVKRLVALSDESKELLAKSLVKDVQLDVAGSIEDVVALLK